METQEGTLVGLTVGPSTSLLALRMSELTTSPEEHFAEPMPGCQATTFAQMLAADRELWKQLETIFVQSKHIVPHVAQQALNDSEAAPVQEFLDVLQERQLEFGE